MCDILDPKAIIFFQARLISISLESFSPHSRKHESSKPTLLFSFGKTARFRMGAEYLKWQFSLTLKKKKMYGQKNISHLSFSSKTTSKEMVFPGHSDQTLITDCTGTERGGPRGRKVTASVGLTRG